MNGPRSEIPRILEYNISDFDDVALARCIALMRLQWQVFLDPHMELETFRRLVLQEDSFLERVVDHKLKSIDPGTQTEKLRLSGVVQFDPEVLKDYPDINAAYADLVALFRNIDRSQMLGSVRIGAWDIPAYFAQLCDLVTGFESYDEMIETTFASLLAVESERHDPEWVHKIIGALDRSWRKRTEFISPQFTGTVSDLTREYLLWLHHHPQALQSIAWEAFERLIAEILASKGFTVELTARTVGSSADVIALSVDQLGITTKYLIECKCYSDTHRVGLDVVNAVLGAKQRAGADHALLVTTSSFTADVAAEEAQWRDMRLHIKDGAAVQEWLRQFDPTAMTGTFVDPGFDKEVG